MARKIEPLAWNSDEYNAVYVHLQAVDEQPYGAAKGNHAALIKLLADMGYGNFNKVEAINVARFLVGESQDPHTGQDWS